MQHKKKQKKGQHIMRHTRFTRTWFSRSSLSILSTELNLGSNRPEKMIFARRISFESFTLDIGVVEQVMKSVMISNKNKVHAERPVTFSYICVWYISPIFKQQQGRTMTMTANRMTTKTTTTTKTVCRSQRKQQQCIPCSPSPTSSKTSPLSGVSSTCSTSHSQGPSRTLW